MDLQSTARSELLSSRSGPHFVLLQTVPFSSEVQGRLWPSIPAIVQDLSLAILMAHEVGGLSPVSFRKSPFPVNFQPGLILH